MKFLLLETGESTISFDFDDTLCMTSSGDNSPNQAVIESLQEHAASGKKCIIITARDPEHEDDDWIARHQPSRIKVAEFVSRHKLPVEKIVFANHEPKGPICKRHGVLMHYDDKQCELDSCQSCGVTAVKVKN